MGLNLLAFTLVVLIYLPLFYLYFNKFSRKKFFEKNSKGLFLAFELISGVLYFLIIICSLTLKNYETNFFFFFGLGVYTLGLFLIYKGYFQFTKSRGLIEKFPFNVSRNPTYFFAFVSMGGLIISFNSPLILTLLILQVISTHVIILKEEEFLERKYGKEYSKYKSKVRRYI